MKLIILLCAVISLTVGFDYGSSLYAKPARYDDYYGIQSPFYVPRRRSDRRHRRYGRHGSHHDHDKSSDSSSTSSSESGFSSESGSSSRHSSEEDIFDDYLFPAFNNKPSYGQPIYDVPAPAAYGSSHLNGK